MSIALTAQQPSATRNGAKSACGSSSRARKGILGSFAFHAVDAVTSVLDYGEDDIRGLDLWKVWATLTGADATASALEDLIGYDLGRKVAYCLGNAHPRLDANPGRSMRSAYEPFEALMRARARRIRIVETPFQKAADQNLVTFGSPSSNYLARNALGYEPVAESTTGFRLRRVTDMGIVPSVTYELSSDDGTVNRLRYREPRWRLATPEGVLQPRLLESQVLDEDFLVLTCTPNLHSAETREILDARCAVRELDNDLDRTSGAVERAELRHKRDSLIPVATTRERRMLIVGGLHGPGTAAARLLLTSKRMMRDLAKAVKRENLDGRFWQAVVRVSVLHDRSTRTDEPGELGETNVYPVATPEIPSHND